MTLVLEDEDVWNIEDGDVFDYQINVGTGSELHYTAERTDSSVGYLKTGGTVKIDAGVVLTSDSCTYNDNPINDNTTGALYYVDEIGLLGEWIVITEYTGAKIKVTIKDKNDVETIIYPKIAEISIDENVSTEVKLTFDNTKGFNTGIANYNDDVEITIYFG